jgi:hypothetical protein
MKTVTVLSILLIALCSTASALVVDYETEWLDRVIVHQDLSDQTLELATGGVLDMVNRLDFSGADGGTYLILNGGTLNNVIHGPATDPYDRFPGSTDDDGWRVRLGDDPPSGAGFIEVQLNSGTWNLWRIEADQSRMGGGQIIISEADWYLEVGYGNGDSKQDPLLLAANGVLVAAPGFQLHIDEGLGEIGQGSDPTGWCHIYTTPIPEPVTLSLLGLGGLALIRRRR